MLNTITVMGRFVDDPLVRYTNSGIAVVSFTLAVERDFKNQAGEKEVDWIDCIAWRNNAEFISKYFSKGRMAIAHGRLQTGNWTDQEGNKRKSFDVNVENIYFGDSKRDSGQESNDYQSNYNAQGTNPPAAQPQQWPNDDELPF